MAMAEDDERRMQQQSRAGGWNGWRGPGDSIPTIRLSKERGCGGKSGLVPFKARVAPIGVFALNLVQRR